MSVFVCFRTLFFLFFVLVNASLLSAAALNLSSTYNQGPLRSVDMYLIFSSATSILFLFPIILVDLLRRGALTSKVWFECTWLFVAWVMNLCGAAAVTALSSSSCAKANTLACSSSRVFMGVTWAATLLVLAQFGLILISAIYYSKHFPEVWKTGVRDFQWWAGGGEGKTSQLASGPPSPVFLPKELSLGTVNPVPHLERMAVNWQPSPPKAVQPQGVVVQAMTVVPASQPQPLTLAYAPEPAPTRRPMHYNASAVISVGVLPQRNPVKKVSVQPQQMSFYPQTVQVAVNASPSQRRVATAPQAPSARIEHAPRPSTASQASSTLTLNEPLPIRDWPRVNPQDPFRKGTKAAPVVASWHADPPPPTVPTTGGKRRSGPKPRPPPLDLSAAQPNRIR